MKNPGDGEECWGKEILKVHFNFRKLAENEFWVSGWSEFQSKNTYDRESGP